MAKKSAEKSASDKEVTLKLRLTPAEHKQVRMAAAECEITIAEFLRRSVLHCAEGEVVKYYQRELSTKRPRGPRAADD